MYSRTRPKTIKLFNPKNAYASREADIRFRVKFSIDFNWKNSYLYLTR